jgi:hypothetical protein
MCGHNVALGRRAEWTLLGLLTGSLSRTAVSVNMTTAMSDEHHVIRPVLNSAPSQLPFAFDNSYLDPIWNGDASLSIY